MDGLVEMHRAVDHGKDQSYVLGVLDQQQLAHSLFPLGDTDKTTVRAEAAARVELTLPDTGVCGGAGLFDDPDGSAAGGCCAPAPATRLIVEPQLVTLGSRRPDSS